VKRIVFGVVFVAIIVSGAFVLEEAIRTLFALERIERERDAWQSPDEIVRQLGLHSGDTVIDLGAGAGYFALKLSTRVGPTGRVLAVDLRRQSLAFLWIRSGLHNQWNIAIIHGRVDDPTVPRGPVDAVLIANTYHELAAPQPILRALLASMRQGARLVVVDRGPREEGEPGGGGHHEIPPGLAERQINEAGFQTVSRTDRFIDRKEDQDLWWLITFQKP
jgi:ubiquinone/menaquinone biosynthesis C-methylase UbiE